MSKHVAVMIINLKFFYTNILVYIWSAKEKADALRRPATGGGPKPPSPSPVEAEFLSGMGDRPTLSGLASGYDTEEGINFYKMCLKLYLSYIKECISTIIPRLHEVPCMTGTIHRNKLKHI